MIPQDITKMMEGFGNFSLGGENMKQVPAKLFKLNDVKEKVLYALKVFFQF